jgi:hypothetical protein
VWQERDGEDAYAPADRPEIEPEAPH